MATNFMRPPFGIKMSAATHTFTYLFVPLRHYVQISKCSSCIHIGCTIYISCYTAPRTVVVRATGACPSNMPRLRRRGFLPLGGQCVAEHRGGNPVVGWRHWINHRITIRCSASSGAEFLAVVGWRSAAWTADILSARAGGTPAVRGGSWPSACPLG